MGILSGLGCSIVSDDWVETGDKHQAISRVRHGSFTHAMDMQSLPFSEKRANPPLISLKTFNKVLLEAPHAVRQKTRAM